MSKKQSKLFKEYDPSQGILFPSNLSEWIPEDHLSRIIDTIIESIDLTPILAKYPGGGRASYHPKMLLKVLIYAYCEKIYSSRKIEKALKENIHFMWLSGQQIPDFRTINRFRLKLKTPIKKIFFHIIKFLMKKKYISFENYFLDGTKLEANANKYTFVWKKATAKYKQMLITKIHTLFDEIEQLNSDDTIQSAIHEIRKKETIKTDDLSGLGSVIGTYLELKPESKELHKIKKKLDRDYITRLQKYENYEKTLGNRNSFSKTDPDATFMRMKEDHMMNGQLKAGYNVQIGTENQFILNYDIHQKPADTTTLIPHLEGLKEEIDSKPVNLIADAGYGSEENYAYLEKENIEGYVKYNTFRLENTKKFKNDPFKKENFSHDIEKDEYTCHAGKKFRFLHTKTAKTENDYKIEMKIYECENCDGCEHRDKCFKGLGNRRIQMNDALEKHKDTARKLLQSEEGIKLRKQRSIDVESVFGHIKSCRGFTRFMLRGLEKVSLEWGLLSIAHNMRKVWSFEI